MIGHDAADAPRRAMWELYVCLATVVLPARAYGQVRPGELTSALLDLYQLAEQAGPWLADDPVVAGLCEELGAATQQLRVDQDDADAWAALTGAANALSARTGARL